MPSGDILKKKKKKSVPGIFCYNWIVVEVLNNGTKMFIVTIRVWYCHAGVDCNTKIIISF